MEASAQSQNGEVRRPGISVEFLRKHNIRHVGRDESSNLIGYPAPGILIPYTTLDGAPLIVNGQPFYRIRLDVPTSAKYLSPKGSGAQLCIPLGQTFGKELVVGESEFKAYALAEAGIPTVGIGGICSAMTDGKLIPEFEKLITKHPPKRVFFLGDADTCFLSAFAIEAIKMAKALPTDCELFLPRIPITMPNGIDDCRDKLREKFASFWKEIKEQAILVDPKLPPAALALRLILPQLTAIAGLAETEIPIERLAVLASWLPAIELETLAREINKVFKITKGAFQTKVKDLRKARAKQEAEQSQSKPRKVNPDNLANDPRPRVEIPGSRERLSSEFADELGPILAKHRFFVKDKLIVVPDPETSGLQLILPTVFKTQIEKYVIPFKVVKNSSGVLFEINHSISKEEADTVLQSEQLARHLPKIRGINDVRLPVRRANGRLELLPEGYDSESRIYTLPDGPEIKEVEVELAREALKDIFSEFCFLQGDEKRSTAIALAAMLTLFNFSILPPGTLRPAFIYTANAEGSGKTLLAKIAIITRSGKSSGGPWPEKPEELEKRLFAASLVGAFIFFLDNANEVIGNKALESALTLPTIGGRILGISKYVDLENLMTVFITGNGATVSPDMRRRSLQIELHLNEARAEDRVIKHPLNDVALQELRPELLSCLWSLTSYWDKSGQPQSTTLLNTFETWSGIIGGILECNGFDSPVGPTPAAATTGDRDNMQITILVNTMKLNTDYHFADLVSLAQELDLFAQLVGDGSDDTFLEKKEKSTFSAILRRFRDRKFSSGRVFRQLRSSRYISVYYVETA
jgi:hypothetical protein